MTKEIFLQINYNNLFETYQGIIGVFITGGIAILLFLLGIKKERKLHQEKLETEYKITLERERKYLKAMLKRITRDIEKQNDYYNNWCNEISKNPYQLAFPQQRPRCFLKILLEKDSNTLFEVFKMHEIPMESFNETIYSLAYLSDIFTKTYDDFVHGNGKMRQDAAQTFASIVIKIIANDINNLNPQEKKFTLAHKKEITEKNNPEIRELKKDYQNLIKPIVDYYKKNKVSPEYINQYYLLAFKAGDYRETIKGLNNYLKNNLKSVIPEIDKKCKSLNEIINKL